MADPNTYIPDRLFPSDNELEVLTRQYLGTQA